MCCVRVFVYVCMSMRAVHPPCAGLVSEYISGCCAGRFVHHALQMVDNQLTQRQALTLDYSHAEEAALGLAARASRALTGPGPAILGAPTHRQDCGVQLGGEDAIPPLTCQRDWRHAWGAN